MMNLSLLLLILATGFCFTDAGDATKTYGRMGSDDRLLEKRRFQRDFNVIGGMTLFARFPQHEPKTFDVPITCIKVIDKINNGPHRYAEIIGGGVEYNFVELKFYSTIYRGFDYEVEIYGKKK